MKRSLVLLVLAFAGTAVVVSLIGGSASASSGPVARPAAALDRGPAYFAVACGFSHRNQDDPIVFPGQRGRSHDHTYFGNTATNAFSTPASLLAAGRTTCRVRGDTAAYWAPTLFVNGRAVEPFGAVAFYVRRTLEDVDPFPQGLQVVAGNANARRAQSTGVTWWSCGSDRRSSTIPTCFDGLRLGLRLHVRFPSCWDGRRLDSADHRSHMAYPSAGRCPASHPVEVPGLTLVVYYGVAGGSAAELASGGNFSGHADFVNAWDRRTLAALVDRYLNGGGYRFRRP